MPPRPMHAAPQAPSSTPTDLSKPDSRFDLGVAYNQSDASIARFRQSVDELRQALTAMMEHGDDNSLDRPQALNLSESAKRVQQWLLGDQRRPEPTEAYVAITGHGPDALKAINDLQEAASRFARRDQTLLVLPGAAASLDKGALATLKKALDKAAISVPQLAPKPVDNTDTIAAILGNLDHTTGNRVFGALQATVETPATKAAATSALAYQIALDQQVIPALNAAQETLRATKALAAIGHQLAKQSAGEARHGFAIQALDALTRRDQGPELAKDGQRNQAIILPGSAGGAAARAASALITSNLDQEMAQATSLHALANNPKVSDHLIAFASHHDRLDQALGKALSQSDELEASRDDKNQTLITRSERGRLNRMMVARDTAQGWMKQAIAGNTMPAGHEAMIVAAQQPAAAVSLVHDGLKDALGSGYRGHQDWHNPAACAATDIEIAARTRDLAGDEPLDLNALDPASLDAAANRIVGTDTIQALKQKPVVQELISRFPETAAKLTHLLADHLDRPDFAAMGIDLPKPAAPAQATPGPRLILPRR